MSERIPSLSQLYIYSDEKRRLDAVLGAVLSLAAAPVEAATILALRKNLDRGPMYFRQQRVGVEIIKLRTMTRDANREGKESVWDASSLKDVRIPSAAAEITRRARLDEIPQFRRAAIGALRNDWPRMSLVGVRPLVPKHAQQYYELVAPQDEQLADSWMHFQRYGPQGTISPASLHYMGRADNTDIDVKHWMELETDYCLTADRQTDLRLIGQTLGNVMIMGAQVSGRLLQRTFNAWSTG